MAHRTIYAVIKVSLILPSVLCATTGSLLEQVLLREREQDHYRIAGPRNKGIDGIFVITETDRGAYADARLNSRTFDLTMERLRTTEELVSLRRNPINPVA